ncbi:ATP-binding protein [Candidatus Leptofilum sp.]|uniref:ATP-binding protein n=1 Tax=Candidatus Leptofilum sp. TaxID=3241576 RepID=UPI003B5A8E47
MSGLKLWLFGSPRLEVAAGSVEINRHKALALLAYLAVTGEAQQRDSLAALLWPDSSQSRARASLRRDLSVLNKALGNQWLITEREVIDLHHQDIWLDVAQFQQLLTACTQHGHEAQVVCAACLPALEETAALYTDHFLAGFSLPNCPDFDEWQFFQTEALRQEFATALKQLVTGFSTRGEYERAIPYGRRWVALDPLHEPAHRALMLLYGRSQQQSAAIRQYKICVQTLQDELGVDPAQETTALYKQIRLMDTTGTGAERDSSETIFLNPSAQAHNLPTPATPFVGREATLSEITQRLTDPSCRLLSLVGLGGIGKTRLAIQVAQNLAEQPFKQAAFTDGIYFVRLSSLNSVGQLVTAVANAIHFSFYQDVDPAEQLFNYLREKKILLVLDNFEHLLDLSHQENGSDGAGFVAALLAKVPFITILVTTRERLNLQEEWVYPVDGMRYPDNDDVKKLAELEGYSAIQLFGQSAQRVQPDFSLRDEQACVLKICRLVEGVPLALELAATWLKVLPCVEIAREIERSLDLLTTTLRNVPDRHRSMRLVFEHSWQLLSAREQAVLQRLSLFQGGFRQRAAAQVAGAMLPDLAALVEKSLLKVRGNGRYYLHDLLRQFTAEKLAENPQAKKDAQNKHRDFFIGFLQKQEPLLKGKQQKTALEELREEISNVQTAWQLAVAQQNMAAVEKGLDSLYEFYWISSRYQEGVDTLRQTAVQLDDHLPETLSTKLVARQGALYAALGMYGLARELLQKSLSGARQLQLSSEIVFSLDALGKVMAVQGDSAQAAQLYKEGLTLSRGLGSRRRIAVALYNLGWIAVGEGDYPMAKRHFTESLSLNRASENEIGIAEVLDSLGMVDFFLGEYAAAEGHFQESLAIFRAVGDKHGMARAISGLGIVAWGVGGERLQEARQLIAESVRINRAIGHRLEVARRLGYLGAVANSLADFAAAEQIHTEALTIAREIGFSFGEPWSLVGLGMAAAGRGDGQTAQTYFHEALEQAIQAHNMPIVLDALLSLAELMARQNQKADAVAVVTAVRHHPAIWQIIKERAARLLTQLEPELPPEIFAQAREQGKTKPVAEFVVDILSEKL